MRASLLALLLPCAVSSYAQGCSATPEAAAVAAIGSAPPLPSLAGTTGYRVQDVQADPVMHRMWLRVGRCDAPSAPLILVPVRAGLAGDVQSPQPSPGPSAVSERVSIAPGPGMVTAPVAVHAGDAVKAVFMSSNVHMELDATANGQAAVGGVVEITLARRGDEPPHRMHGVLRAQSRVEVQP